MAFSSVASDSSLAEGESADAGAVGVEALALVVGVAGDGVEAGEEVQELA